jgi:5-formyltetrahydrofolate cyclo-ligase
MPSGEIQTDAIVRHALSAGKAVYVPYLHRPTIPESPDSPPRVMDMVRLTSIDDYETLARDRWGIPSIDPSTVHERDSILGSFDKPAALGLDFMLMPGVAFDLDSESGRIRRLGHGKGFYDYFIHRYLAKFVPREGLVNGPLLLRYGLGLEEQFLTAPSGMSIPVGPLDKDLHGVILGSGKVHRATSQTHEG